MFGPVDSNDLADCPACAFVVGSPVQSEGLSPCSRLKYFISGHTQYIPISHHYHISLCMVMVIIHIPFYSMLMYHILSPWIPSRHRETDLRDVQMRSQHLASQWGHIFSTTFIYFHTLLYNHTIYIIYYILYYIYIYYIYTCLYMPVCVCGICHEWGACDHQGYWPVAKWDDPPEMFMGTMVDCQKGYGTEWNAGSDRDREYNDPHSTNRSIYIYIHTYLYRVIHLYIYV